MINVFQPALGAEELDAVRQVFESNWPGKGVLTDRFEAAFAEYIETERALVRSANSCTEVLFLAGRLLGIGPGDDVILPSISFVGAANAILDWGAQPVFCDVDPRSLNCTASTIEACITSRTKAVLLLHYGGVPCGHFGDISAWSFDSMKALVTGDGGMIRCRTAEMAVRAEQLLYLGLGSQSGLKRDVETRWWEFDVTCAGRRGILTDIASAIGIEQLKKLPRFLARRREIHERYTRDLSCVSWLTLPPPIPEGSVSSYYTYWIQSRTDRRDRLATHLRRNGIYSTFRYHPLHRVAFYGATARLPHAEQAADETLNLPLHPSLSDDDVTHIVTTVRTLDV